jgi:hypothetical protein
MHFDDHSMMESFKASLEINLIVVPLLRVMTFPQGIPLARALHNHSKLDGSRLTSRPHLFPSPVRGAFRMPRGRGP